MLGYSLEEKTLTRIVEGFTLELTVNKEVLKVVTCSFPLMLTMNKGTDISEKLKVTPAQNNNFCVI